jgi:hypothetical protein
LPHPDVSAFHHQTIVADTPLSHLSTSRARHWHDRQGGFNSPVDWGSRGITRLGTPPPDIWRRVHCPVRPRNCQEEWFKFLYNALPLGHRIRFFAPEDANCHACPLTLQTHCHFIFSCQLAQVVWQELRQVFGLSAPVSLHHAAFSWSLEFRSHHRSFGVQLQAGHAIAFHVLWLAHVAARFDNRSASAVGIRAQFRYHLLRHLRDLHELARRRASLASFWEQWDPVVLSDPVDGLTFRH